MDGFYEAWQDHLWAVQSVSMDLWPAFIGGARKWLEMLTPRYALTGSMWQDFWQGRGSGAQTRTPRSEGGWE